MIIIIIIFLLNLLVRHDVPYKQASLQQRKKSHATPYRPPTETPPPRLSSAYLPPPKEKQYKNTKTHRVKFWDRPGCGGRP